VQYIPGEVWTAIAALLTGFSVHFLHKRRNAGRGTPRESVTGAIQFDRAWVQRMEDHAKRSHEFANSIAQSAYRITQLEKWKDGHESEDRRAHERLAVVEQQYAVIREAQEAQRESNEQIRESIERILSMLEEELRDTRDRLRDVEKEIRK
jgi:chromosome segregation ATPase